MLKEQDMDYKGYLENCSQRQIKMYCLAAAVQYTKYQYRPTNGLTRSLRSDWFTLLEVYL